jgi:predicted AAA+ superfamily ATPase
MSKSLALLQWVMSGLMQCSKTTFLFDHLIAVAKEEVAEAAE